MQLLIDQGDWWKPLVFSFLPLADICCLAVTCTKLHNVQSVRLPMAPKRDDLFSGTHEKPVKWQSIPLTNDVLGVQISFICLSNFIRSKPRSIFAVVQGDALLAECCESFGKEVVAYISADLTKLACNKLSFRPQLDASGNVVRHSLWVCTAGFHIGKLRFHALVYRDEEKMKDIQQMQKESAKLRLQLRGLSKNPQQGKLAALFLRAMTLPPVPDGQKPLSPRTVIGWANLSLKNCVLGTSQCTALPLICPGGDRNCAGASILVCTRPSRNDDVQTIVEYPDLRTATEALSGKQLNLTVFVISAEGIPEAYQKKVTCWYAFAKKEEKIFATDMITGSMEPIWNDQRKFSLRNFSPKHAEYLSKGDVLTFLVTAVDSGRELLGRAPRQFVDNDP